MTLCGECSVCARAGGRCDMPRTPLTSHCSNPTRRQVLQAAEEAAAAQCREIESALREAAHADARSREAAAALAEAEAARADAVAAAAHAAAATGAARASESDARRRAEASERAAASARAEAQDAVASMAAAAAARGSGAAAVRFFMYSFRARARARVRIIADVCLSLRARPKRVISRIPPTGTRPVATHNAPRQTESVIASLREQLAAERSTTAALSSELGGIVARSSAEADSGRGARVRLTQAAAAAETARAAAEAERELALAAAACVHFTPLPHRRHVRLHYISHASDSRCLSHFLQTRDGSCE